MTEPKTPEPQARDTDAEEPLVYINWGRDAFGRSVIRDMWRSAEPPIIEDGKRCEQ